MVAPSLKATNIKDVKAGDISTDDIDVWDAGGRDSRIREITVLGYLYGRRQHEEHSRQKTKR